MKRTYYLFPYSLLACLLCAWLSDVAALNMWERVPIRFVRLCWADITSIAE